ACATVDPDTQIHRRSAGTDTDGAATGRWRRTIACLRRRRAEGGHPTGRAGQVARPDRKARGLACVAEFASTPPADAPMNALAAGSSPTMRAMRGSDLEDVM